MVGIKTADQAVASKSETQDPSKSLFALLESLLEEAQLTLPEIASIAFCEGPGSMLGARTASMAIRSWQAIDITGSQRLYSYSSLTAGAVLASRHPQTPESGLVVTDARRSSWNSLAYPASTVSELELKDNSELEAASLSLVTFSEFPSWTETTATLQAIDYDPISLFADKSFESYLRPVETATPLTIRSAAFKKWEAKIHTSSAQ